MGDVVDIHGQHRSFASLGSSKREAISLGGCAVRLVRADRVGFVEWTDVGDICRAMAAEVEKDGYRLTFRLGLLADDDLPLM
jgi:hypothetical protein